MARIMEAAGVRSKGAGEREKNGSVHAKARLEQTFPITQRLWMDAEVDGDTVQGWAVAGAIATVGEDQTAYLVVTSNSAPIWVLSHEVKNAVLERAD